MTPIERRAALWLAVIYMSRMIGLFSILPVLALFDSEFSASTPFLLGLALGIYGLFQAAFQIPLGLLSDKIGRKRTLVIGLALMAVGSVIAALAESIYGVIVGRALQGSGAIAATLMALAADLSREEQRTKIMAMLGASIGVSFILALMFGPFVIGYFSVRMLFWFNAVAAVFSAIVLYTLVPDPAQSGFHADTTARVETLGQLFRNPELRYLNLSIFCLHIVITALFVAVPVMLRQSGMDDGSHWHIYLPAVGLSVLALVPMIILAERHQRMRLVLLLCVSGLLVTQLLFATGPITIMWLFGVLLLFFCFLNTLEALLPSLLSRIAPAGSRGGANGIYSSSQFRGGANGIYSSSQFLGGFVGVRSGCTNSGILLRQGCWRPDATS